MLPAKSAFVTSVLSSAIIAQSNAAWIFKYPYGNDGSCQCEESVIGCHRNFTHESDCLKAFKNDPNEHCSFDDGGVSGEQCFHSVSIQPEKINTSGCTFLCTQVVAGLVPFSEFSQLCSFEIPVNFGTGLGMPYGSCFSSYIYGWSDFDPHNQIQAPPLALFLNVPTAAQCQALCQVTRQCAAFSWRALPDESALSNVFNFQNPPKTCLLYTKEYMDSVVNKPLDSSILLTGGTSSCNVQKVEDCLLLSASPRIKAYNPFLEKSCLLCGCDPRCIWKSRYHITGPVYCSKTPAPNRFCQFSPPGPTKSPTAPPPVLTTLPTTPARPPRPVCPDSCVDDCDDVIGDDCFPDC